MKREEAIAINNLFDLKAQLRSLLNYYKHKNELVVNITSEKDNSPEVTFEGPQAEYMIKFLQDFYDKIDKELEEMEIFGIKYAPRYIFSEDLAEKESTDNASSELERKE